MLYSYHEKEGERCAPIARQRSALYHLHFVYSWTVLSHSVSYP